MMMSMMRMCCRHRSLRKALTGHRVHVTLLQQLALRMACKEVVHLRQHFSPSMDLPGQGHLQQFHMALQFAQASYCGQHHHWH